MTCIDPTLCTLCSKSTKYITQTYMYVYIIYHIYIYTAHILTIVVSFAEAPVSSNASNSLWACKTWPASGEVFEDCGQMDKGTLMTNSNGASSLIIFGHNFKPSKPVNLTSNCYNQYTLLIMHVHSNYGYFTFISLCFQALCWVKTLSWYHLWWVFASSVVAKSSQIQGLVAAPALMVVVIGWLWLIRQHINIHFFGSVSSIWSSTTV